MSWQERRLGDLVRLRSGGTPSKAIDRYWGGEIPWLSSKDLTTVRIYDAPLKVTEVGASNGTRLMPENTVMFVVRGMSLASEFRVSITKRVCAFNQDLKAAECSDEIIPEFLFYSLFAQRERIKGQAGEASHGTKKLESHTVESIRLKVPEIAVQERVVGIAAPLDDLIENNHRRIALLEQAARMLYREWFIHFRFPGHEHVKIVDGFPEGWERRTLGDLLTLKRGYDLPEPRRVVGTVPIVSSSGITGYHNVKKADGPGIVTGRYGTIGEVFLVDEDYWPLNTALYVFDKKENPTIFLLHVLRHAMGSVQSDKAAVPGVNRNILHMIKLDAPPVRLRRQFEETVAPYFEQSRVLRETNQKLAQARDLLLPRLMNGEIAI